MSLPCWVALYAGMTLLQPGSGTEGETSVSVARAFDGPVLPTTSLEPPPHAASTVAVTVSTAAWRNRRVSLGNLCTENLSLQGGWTGVPGLRKGNESGREPINGHYRHQTAIGHGVIDNSGRLQQRYHQRQ